MHREISELLGKAISRGALDEELSAHDKERMLAFLQHYGDLSPNLRYEGSTRSGYKTLPGPAERRGHAHPGRPHGDDAQTSCRRARRHRHDPPSADALLRGARPRAESALCGDEL